MEGNVSTEPGTTDSEFCSVFTQLCLSSFAQQDMSAEACLLRLAKFL
jgi:hypothetical protein